MAHMWRKVGACRTALPTFAHRRLFAAGDVRELRRKSLAFEQANFGGSAAISLLMVAIGLLGAVLILSTTNIFSAD